MAPDAATSQQAVALRDQPAMDKQSPPPAEAPAESPDRTTDLPRPPARTAWLAGTTTAVLFWAGFFPLDWGFLGWICLVPLILLVRLPVLPRQTWWALSVTGSVCMTVLLQWMRLGDLWMIPAWFALATYVGLYFPLFVVLSRTAVHRLRVPLGLAVPVIWVGLEYARAHLVTGFAWYYLAHTQYGFTELIQLSDLVGAYGVSFVIALAAAAVAGCLPMAWLVRGRLLPVEHVLETHVPGRPRTTVVVAVAAVALAVVYGHFRRGQADFTTGPRIALIQGNFTSSLKDDPEEHLQILYVHRRLTGVAVKHQANLIVWPETMFRGKLLELGEPLTDDQLRQAAPGIPPEHWRTTEIRDLLGDLAAASAAGMVMGIERIEARQDRLRAYNSAIFIDPDTGLSSHYDKLHRVPFGEYIPFSEELPWLHHLTPFPAGFGIAAGSRASVFEYQRWLLTPLICYEDTVPHLVRGIVRAAGRKHSRPDVLVNLTNDGWFHGSSELDQHLVTAAFRAVECRTPMVRAVNTGISAVIDGDGVIREPEVFIDGDAILAREQAMRDPSLSEAEMRERIAAIDATTRKSMRDPATGRWHRQLNAVLVDNVPLDNRRSLYVAGGDWFASGCGLGCLGVLACGVVIRLRRRRDDED